MVFSSFTFLFYFFPIFFITYFLMPKKLKNLCIFIFSLIFYAWGEPIYVLLMLFSTLNDFFFGKLIYKYQNTKNISRMFLIFSIIINLLLLTFFKYSDFLIGITNNLFHINIPYLNLALPIGISFYTFQTMSYSIDIYKGIAKPQNNIIDFGTYVTLFPQLIAGPIVTYNQIEKEIKERKPQLDDGLSLFIIGLAKKVILANNLGNIWEQTQSLYSHSTLSYWVGLICFGLQIYFDFSGYSDMAIGLGKMLGFHFPQNFNYPYISQSITEFWRRWHMTLGGWFRDYVYIPLGGNKKGFKKQIVNIFIVWFLTGLWHGASYNFILWGLYFAIILVIEKTFLLKLLQKTPKIIQHLYALFFIIIGWVFFAIEDINTIINYFKGLFTFNNLYNIEIASILYNNKILLLIAMLCCTPLVKKCYEKIKYKKILLFLLFILTISFLISSSYNPFLYFRF